MTKATLLTFIKPDLITKKEMRSCFSCADPWWLAARSHLTLLVKGGEIKERRKRGEKKTHIHSFCVLPCQRCPSVSWMLDGSAMMTAEAQGTERWGLYQRCGSALNFWLRLAEWSRVLLAVTGPGLKKEIIFKAGICWEAHPAQEI